MKVEVGTLADGKIVKCIDTVFQDPDNAVLYREGIEYKCADGDCIIDEFNEPRCWAQWPGEFQKYFILI